MNKNIERIRQAIEPLRQEIIRHEVYSAVSDVEDLKIFMQHHVFAVWDFMSLLKSLQNALTCTGTPWFPKGDAATRHLINEIVVGEESDVDEQGRRCSHFELYLEAMRQCGADTSAICRFIEELKRSGDFSAAYAVSGVPATARNFVNFTFSIINSGEASLQAAIFTFGREDLIPGMFLSMVKDLDKKFPGNISTFKYYLERHIEVDGDHHSHLALQMTANLCGENEALWKHAEEATINSLRKRKELWDGVLEEIRAKRQVAAQN